MATEKQTLVPIVVETALPEDDKGLRYVKVTFDYGYDRFEVSTDLETGLSRVLVVVPRKKKAK